MPINSGPINDYPIDDAPGLVEPAPLVTLDDLDEPGEPLWLLEMVIGGHVYRYSTERVVVYDVDGGEYVFDEGLGEPGVSYGSVAGVGDAAIGLTVDADEDWSLLVAQGHALDGCPADLWRWRRGDEYERARLVLRGLTSDPAYGARHEVLAISIVRALRELSVTLPPVQAVVDSTTWPRVGGDPTPAESRGLPLPIVIGLPGWDPSDATLNPVVPVPLVEYDVGGGLGTLVWIGEDATSARVAMVLGEDVQQATLAVSPIEDLVGRAVASIAPTLPADAAGAAFFVAFGPTGGGGLQFEGRLLRGAGDVIAWVLSELYTGAVDHGRLQAVRTALNAYQIDTWINAPIAGWDWLQAEVLPLLPVEMREGRDGVYPALLRWDLTAEDRVTHLVAGEGVERDGPVSFDTRSVANEVTIEFQPARNGWIGRRTVTALDAARVTGRRDWSAIGADARIYGDARCTESQRRYGVRPLRIQAGAVWDVSTALLIARDVVARRALPRRSIRYAGGTELEAIEIGQAVTLDDDELHLDGAVCLVADVTPVAGGTSLDLVVL